jgi:RHS repeat-associated protein
MRDSARFDKSVLIVANADGRLTDIETDLKVGYHFEFDANDRITGFTNFANGFWSQSFGYDDLHRLTAANSPGLGNQAFTYDANGNRKTHAQGGTTAYAIGNTNNRLTALSGSANRSYTYTPTGHVKTITGFGGGGETIFRNGFQIEPLPVTTYGYDPFDRLTSVTGPGINASYQLGADGTRYQKTANGETTRFVYGRGGQLLSEHRQSPARWTNYLWLNGEPVGLVRDNALYWIQNDHLGRPEGITDQTRQRVWRANLRAFDRKVITDDLGGFHLGFPGQYHDTETGHAYNIHRDYDPGTGRYLQSDPIGLAGGINTYAYAETNPVSLTDPLGLDVCLESTNAILGLHQRVGIYSEIGNFVYGQSFGEDENNPGMGYVYQDLDDTGNKGECISTSNEQNSQMMQHMQSELATTGPYSVTGIFGMNCRSYSRGLFERIVNKPQGGGR